MPLIELKNVKKEYKTGEVITMALNDVSFEVESGEFVIIVGPSGAGKTTVLNLIGGMDTCTSGEIWVAGTQINGYNAKQLTTYRRNEIGFVFQFYNLVANLTALENVELATQICPNALDPAQILEQVGLAGKMSNFPTQLSGGEQQRVAIARAIAKNPSLLLCDEPTGALDYVTGKKILGLLQHTCRNMGMTVVIITHNGQLAPTADRVIRFKNGQVESCTLNAKPVPVKEIEW